ncbi:MAG: hypothetical protein LBR95_05660 [Azoarcus sp.]|jgi:hypothetical protein|nr:hypothetical protein [Azoarcus sp.]
MPFQPLGFVSALAYLALCLLIAASRAWEKCPREGLFENTSITEQSAGESSRHFLCSLSASCLISLSSFLFMPCGTLPSLLSASGGALVVVGTLAVAPGFWGGWAKTGKGWARRAGVAFCLGVSLFAIARYARQRGIPGELYALDAYVATPLMGVTDAWEKWGLHALAAASLLALCGALPAPRLSARGEKLPESGEAFLAALAAELWMLAAIVFWICLFFPYAFSHFLDYHAPGSWIFSVGGFALDALIFWVKALGLEWGLGRMREKWLRVPFHASIPFALLALGAWLLAAPAA